MVGAGQTQPPRPLPGSSLSNMISKMIRMVRRSLFLFSLLSALMVALVILGVLEYRWAAGVSETSRKWLVINFAVLIVLALGLVAIVSSILRAQALLRLQMEFVAEVSHELRTPL